MQLRLSLPEVADKPDPSVEIRGVFVEEWVESLPYANPVKLIEVFLATLERSNRSPMKPQQRLALLELYMQPYRFLLELQEKHGPIHGIAAFERYRADTAQARHVAAEMAFGYKRVVVDMGGRRALFGGRRERALALQRAMLFLSLVLLHSYDEYLPIPDDVWPEIHQIIALARSEGLASTAVGGRNERSELTQCCEDLYRRMLLTSLVDPYHLAYGEIWKVYALLGDCAGLASIAPPAEAGKSAGLFVIDPASHHRPLALARIGDELPEGASVLDANPVSERLEAIGGRDASISPVLLSAMTRAFGLPPKRHAPRERTEGRVRLTTGISSLHHFLGGMRMGDAAIDAPARGHDADMAGADPDEPALEEVTEHSYTAEFWELLDKGPGGIGVVKRIRPNIPVRVGEIIGIQLSSGEAEPWAVGAVRWLSIANAGEYQAGVQLLARGAEPCALRIADVASEVPVLVLPGLAEPRKATLVSPPGTYRKGLMLELLHARGRMSVVAGALHEQAAGYERFAFTVGD